MRTMRTAAVAMTAITQYVTPLAMFTDITTTIALNADGNEHNVFD